MSGETEGSDRPYTVGSFQAKLNQFQDLMKEITLQDIEATPEEKRQMITGDRLILQYPPTLQCKPVQ